MLLEPLSPILPANLTLQLTPTLLRSIATLHGCPILLRRMAEIVRRMKKKHDPTAARKEETGRKYYEKIMAIPMIITVVMRESPNVIVREEDFSATSCVIRNFSLLAWEQGIGLEGETYGWLLEADFRDAMGIVPGEKVLGNLHVGYPEMIPAAKPRVPASECVILFREA